MQISECNVQFRGSVTIAALKREHLISVRPASFFLRYRILSFTKMFYWSVSSPKVIYLYLWNLDNFMLCTSWR